jgi:hypothetical protein
MLLQNICFWISSKSWTIKSNHRNPSSCTTDHTLIRSELVCGPAGPGSNLLEDSFQICAAIKINIILTLFCMPAIFLMWHLIRDCFFCFFGLLNFLDNLFGWSDVWVACFNFEACAIGRGGLKRCEFQFFFFLSFSFFSYFTKWPSGL